MPSLVEYLHDFVRQAQFGAPELEQKLRDIQARKIEIERKLNTARVAGEREINFIAILGLDRQCPRCWIEEEHRSRLSPMQGGARGIDYFRCDVCNYEYELSA